MKRSKFSLSHTTLFTGEMGELIPCGILEVLPGDTFQHGTSALVRTMPMVTPPMHPVNVRVHHWFVPSRLLWNGWEDFITGGPDGRGTSEGFPVIKFPQAGAAVGSLADYLGIPTGVPLIQVNALPFRAYNMIWNEWYRDEDLQTKLVIANGGGLDTTTNLTLQNCSWEKDYFTSSRPWEQKGPAVTLPIGSRATVRTSGQQLVTGAASPLTMTRMDGSGPGNGNMGLGGSQVQLMDHLEGGFVSALYPNNLYADLASASSVTVNALRRSLAIQRYEEARARYGSRYTEYLRYLGIKSSDARLQRPEYLGGGRQTIQFSEVLQTAPQGSSTSSVVGSMRGHGLGALRSNRYRRFFEEHGFVISLMSVLPKTMYHQGLFRKWNRRIKEDYWQQELQHIGQQPVMNKEVYAAHPQPDDTFGYQNRYDEYRREESRVAGLFRSTFSSWHFARDFSSAPALNGSFVQAVPTKNPFADQNSDVLLVMARHSVQARRIVSASTKSFIY